MNEFIAQAKRQADEAAFQKKLFDKVDELVTKIGALEAKIDELSRPGKTKAKE